MVSMHNTLVVLLLCLWLPLNTAKIVHGTLHLDSLTTEQYVSKFSFMYGMPGEVSGVFTNLNPKRYFDGHRHELLIALYDETAWEKFRTAMDKGSLCIHRRMMATWSQLVRSPSRSENLENFRFKMPVKSNDRKSHYWYAMVMDCSLEEYDAHPPEMSYDITFLNANSHLPADEWGLTTGYMVITVLLFSLFCLYVVLVRKQWKKTNQIHLIAVLVAIAFWLQITSVLSELAHLKVYHLDGKGLRLRYTWLCLDFVALISQGMSELIMSYVLIAVACGWTLVPSSSMPTSSSVFTSLSLSLSKPGKFFKSLNPALVVFLVVFCGQIMLQYLGRRFEDGFNQFHDHEHWPGHCLMGMRIFLWSLFIYGTVVTVRMSRDANVARFLAKLSFAGTVWFLAFPGMVFMTRYVPAYNRHLLVTCGAIGLQSLALLCFLYMTTCDSGYYRLSTLSKMGTIGVGQSKGKLAVD